jgi:hypothetical protein
MKMKLMFLALALLASPGVSHQYTLQGTDGESEGGHLSELNHHVWFRITASQPNWAYGYFAQKTGETTPGEPSAELFDREGKFVTQTRIWFPEAVRVTLFDVSPSANGGAVASGFAETSEGTTSFLAETDASGSPISVLQAQTFIAGRVCQASDDTIWVYGGDPSKESADDLTYPLVRQYSLERGLLSSYLPSRLLKNSGIL